MPNFTFNVEVSRGFVRATVAGVRPDVGFSCLLHCQDALLAISSDSNALGGNDFFTVLEPFDVCYRLAEFTDE